MSVILMMLRLELRSSSTWPANLVWPSCMVSVTAAGIKRAWWRYVLHRNGVVLVAFAPSNSFVAVLGAELFRVHYDVRHGFYPKLNCC